MRAWSMLLVLLWAQAAAGLDLPDSLRGPILIEGDGGFTAGNGVVAGTGTADDPFVIAGWSIVAPPGPGVYLIGTTKHVRIEDNTIRLGFIGPYYSAGVRLDQAANVTVANNRIESSAFGVHMRNSTDIVVANNDLVGVQVPGIIVSNGGIQTLGSHGVEIVDNSVRDFGWGISVQHESGDVRVAGNRVTASSVMSGVTVLADAGQVLIENNTVLDSFGGIDVFDAHDVRVTGNTVEGGYRGIGAIGPRHVTFSENVVRDFQVSADLSECEGCVVTRNHFAGSQDGAFLHTVSEVSHNVFRDHDLVFAAGVDQGARIHDNDIDLTNAVYAEVVNGDILDVRHNWWGASGGPDMARFDLVNGTVLVAPWLRAPAGAGP